MQPPVGWEHPPYAETTFLNGGLMYRKSHLALGILAIALSATQTRAEDPRFGVQVHGSIPTGDLKDAVDTKLGLGGGAHVTFDLDDGHVIRPRLDYTLFPEATLTGSGAAVKSKINNLSAGADYLYFVDRKPEGLYFTGGLSFNHWKVDVNIAGISSSATSNKAGVAVGVGYNYNASFGAELRYTTSKYDSGNKSSSAGALQASVTLRF
jgi:hypothetical protein